MILFLIQLEIVPFGASHHTKQRATISREAILRTLRVSEDAVLLTKDTDPEGLSLSA